MKRLGLAVLISFCGLLGYVFAAAILLGFVIPDSDTAAERMLAMPLRLPVIIYDYFFVLPDSGDALFYPLVAGTFVIDIAIYAIPIYLVLTLIARRKRPEPVVSNEPPPPPTFDD